LRPDQIDLAGSAFSAYKNASKKNQHSEGKADTFLDEAWHFSRIAGGYTIPIEFIGVWDTVASVIVPRQDRFLLDMQTLVYTRTNPGVRRFRQAISIDERRRMFRLNRWKDPQEYRSDQFDPSTAVDQDIRQVWFAGVHADIGGGYLEKESGLSKFPLLWMIAQAEAAGLRVDRSMVDHLGWGQPRQGSTHLYVAPDPTACLHVSLKGAWWILEWWPKREKWREWPDRKCFLGLYLPLGEPRLIREGALIHRSVIERIAEVPSYRPINMPSAYAIEEIPLAPVANAGADLQIPNANPQ
jgi:uncharacterized protein (DUF2235 family)